MVGAIWSPHATFTAVMAHPAWLGMLLVTILIPAGGGAIFLSSDVGQRALVEQQAQSVVDLGLEVTDEQYRQFEEFAPLAAAFQFGALAAGVPLVTLIVTTLLFVTCSGFLGSVATFRQMYSVVVHSGVVFVVQALFVGPLNYFRAEMSSPTTLAAFAPMLETGSLAMRFLSAIDFFFVWWIALLAIGTAVATKRSPTPIAITLFSLYVVVAIVIAFAMTQFAS